MTRETKRFLTAAACALLLVFAVLEERHVPFLQGFLVAPHLPVWLDKPLAVLAWLSLAWAIARGLELFVWRRAFGHGQAGMPRQRKLITDLLDLCLYIIAIGIISIHVFDQPPAGILATSGVVAVVLGFALQQILADVLAGLALNLERPFKAGDWISVDQLQGIVLMTNWRSTHLRTRLLDVVVVPNAVIGRAKLVNHMQPHRLHIDYVDIHLNYGFDEGVAEALFHAAALGVDGVLNDPAPMVLIHDMQPVTVTWRVCFFIDDFSRLIVIKSAVMRAAYAALRTGVLSDYLPRNEAHVSLMREVVAGRGRMTAIG